MSMNPAHQSRKRPGGTTPGSDAVPSGSGGFTVLELVLALALIALFASVLIGGSAQLFRDQPVSADEVFWKASSEARKAALSTGRDVKLAFADDREGGK